MFARPDLKPLVIIFAKAPIPGAVKTRLQLPPDHAARLQQILVDHLWLQITHLRNLVDAELHTDQVTSAWPHIASREIQTGGDLGARLSYAIRNALLRGRPKVMIVGGDTPEPPNEHLTTLLDADVDVALGPTADGGYYAICCRRHHPNMFDDVRWSAETTLTDTVAACLRASLKVAVGPAWFDLDTPADIPRLSDSLRHSLDL